MRNAFHIRVPPMGYVCWAPGNGDQTQTSAASQTLHVAPQREESSSKYHRRGENVRPLGCNHQEAAGTCEPGGGSQGQSSQEWEELWGGGNSRTLSETEAVNLQLKSPRCSDAPANLQSPGAGTVKSAERG